MAVEVLDYQGLSKLRSEADVDEAMPVYLQRMQNLVALLVKQQQQAQQEDCTLMNHASISALKKLIALFGRSGHARFRCGPATAVSQISASQGQYVSGVHEKVRSTSSLHDAAQTKKDFDIDVRPRPNSSCSKLKHDDNMDGKVNGCACRNDASMLRTHVPELDQSFRFKDGNGDRCAKAHALPLPDGRTQRSLHVSGHARCRDAKARKVCCRDSQAYNNTACQLQCPFQSRAELDQADVVPSKTNSSCLSSVSMDGGEGTVSNGKPVMISSGRPPLPPKKRKSSEKVEERAIKCHNSGNCHCAKRRKLATRRIMRVSTIGIMNIADVPVDGYFWCQYRQKFSKDSSQPRVYYKCSSVRGCPARKHVERASDDPNTLVVTYGREHLHPQIHKMSVASE